MIKMFSCLPMRHLEVQVPALGSVVHEVESEPCYICTAYAGSQRSTSNLIPLLGSANFMHGAPE